MNSSSIFDVVVIGGGPAGVSAALTLGRATKRVLLCDAGPRRNAAAEHMHGFVTREGIPPSEFRRIARDQLRPYDVTLKDTGVEVIARSESDEGGFMVDLGDETRVACRRIMLATGMIDEIPNVAGIEGLWGHSVFLCPYCHGWEVRGRRWGFLCTGAPSLEYALLLTGWTSEVTAFTNGPMEIPPDLRERLAIAGVALDFRSVRRLAGGPDRRLTAVEMEDGARVPCDALVVRPPQRQVPLVHGLGLALDSQGYVRVDDRAETSIPGIHAAGDLASPAQSAILAAAAGARAAYALNHALTIQAASRRAVGT